MTRRLLALGAAAAAMLTATAIPVFADDASVAESSGGLTDKTVKAVLGVVNPIAEQIPTPPGWYDRHLCAWSDQADRTFCIFFPWPI